MADVLNTEAETAKNKVRQYLKTFQKLKDDRANFESHWNEVVQLVFPNLSNIVFTGDLPANRGQKRNTLVYESTAVQSNEFLSSNLHALLTSPSSPFFSLTTGNAQLDAVDNVRRWIDDTVETLHRILNNSNFQTEIHEVYQALGSIGTSIMRIEEDMDFIVRFQTRPIFEGYLRENFQKIVDTVYREVRCEWRQLKQEFPQAIEKMPPDLRQKLSKQSDEIILLHVVEPLDIDDPGYAADKKKGWKFSSCYMIKEHEHLLSEGGFEEFPYVTPRWTRTLGEVYGRSPAMKVLPDIKMIQEMMKTTIRGAQLSVAPPLQVPDQGAVMPMKLQPHGINYYRAGTQDKIEPIMTNSRIDFGIQMIENIQARIREAYYVDKLQLTQGPQMTAEEVMTRRDQNMTFMGPILGRQQFELLRPMIERVFGICQRKGGVFKAPPREIQGQPLHVQYISPIARAQRQGELTSLTKVFSVIAPIAQAQPEMLDRFDGDEILKDAGNISGLPARWFRDDKVIQALRDSRAQAHQAMSQQNAQNQTVDNVSKLSQAAAASKQASA